MVRDLFPNYWKPILGKVLGILRLGSPSRKLIPVSPRLDENSSLSPATHVTGVPRISFPLEDGIVKPLPHISPVGSVFQSRSRRDRPPSRKGPALPVKSLLEFTATRHIDSPSGTQRANILGIECGLFTPHGRSRYHLESCTRAGACLTLHPVTNKPRRGSPSAKIPRTSRCCAHHLD